MLCRCRSSGFSSSSFFAVEGAVLPLKGLAKRRENTEEAGRSGKEVGCSGLGFDKEAEERKDWLGEGAGCRRQVGNGGYGWRQLEGGKEGKEQGQSGGGEGK